MFSRTEVGEEEEGAEADILSEGKGFYQIQAVRWKIKKQKKGCYEGKNFSIFVATINDRLYSIFIVCGITMISRHSNYAITLQQNKSVCASGPMLSLKINIVFMRKIKAAIC